MNHKKVLLSCILVISAAQTAKAQAIRYSEAQLNSFAQTNIAPVLGAVMEAQLPYPEINARIKKQDELIHKHFPGKKIRVILKLSYSNMHVQVLAASGIFSTGEPGITLYVPSILTNEGGNQAAILRTIMHERDHLTEMRKNVDTVNLEKEIHFQALTTEFVTVPMKEKYNIPLVQSDLAHYDAWIKAKRSEKNPVWRNHIQTMLSPVLK